MAEEWLEPDKLLLIEGWARDKITDKDIAEKFIGISDRSFRTWKEKYPSFTSALKKGRAPIAEKIENSLYDLCETQEYTDTVIEEYYDKDNVMTSRHIRKVKRQVPPNTTAIIFALKNLKAQKWREKQTVTVEDKRNGQLADLIEGLKEDDLYTETETPNEAMADEPVETN